MNIIFQFTKKNMLKNKNRTIVTILGILLTCVLMFGLGFFASTIRESLIIEEKQNVGSYHVLYEQLPFSKKQVIQNHLEIDRFEYQKQIGQIEWVVEKQKRTVQIYDRNDYQLEPFYLESGRYPKNKNELLVSKSFAQMVHKNIGESIILDDQTYQIVGILKGDDYSFYTILEEKVYTNTGLFEPDDMVDYFITFKKYSDILNNISLLSDDLDLEPIYQRGGITRKEEHIHENLLELYGETKQYGKMAILLLILILILTVLACTSILVIYNSFAISLMERKKIMGILSSLGATRWQLLCSIFIEATILSCIAIPIGFFISIFGVQTLVFMINRIMEGVSSYSFHIYPLFVWIPFLFILISIYLSAFFPAMRAFEITPMEAIRQTDDIKVKHKLKNKKFFLFEIEASIAYKNSKRNRKKYRITTLSLVVSIVLFLVCSTFFNYYEQQIPDYLESNLDVQMQVKGAEKRVEHFYNELIKGCEIDIERYYESNLGFFQSDVDPIFHPNYSKLHDDRGYPISIMVLRDSDFEQYLKKINQKEVLPVLVNMAEWDVYEEDFSNPTVIEHKKTKIYENVQNLNLHISLFLGLDVDHQFQLMEPISKFYESELLPDSFDQYSPYALLILPNTIYQSFGVLKDSSYIIELSTKDYKKIDSNFKQLRQDYLDLTIEYQNIGLEVYQANRKIFLLKFLLYVLIGFILLIAISSVFNTIYTSIQLRKKEFAILKSVGMTSNGFHKMMFFESFLFGFRSLFWGILISFGLIRLIMKIQMIIPESPNYKILKIPFPTFYVWITIIGVFILVFITIFYSIRKLNYENLMDVLKDENF